MLAYDFPLLSVFWTMLIFFGFAIWIYLLVIIFADIFRSTTLVVSTRLCGSSWFSWSPSSVYWRT